MQSELTLTTRCFRCDEECRTGTPDPTKRAIVQASTAGYCAACMITIFLHGIEPIAATINGTHQRPGLGPEIFLDQNWRETVLRPVMASVLAHTQMPEDAINWINVVSNWSLPIPSDHRF